MEWWTWWVNAFLTNKETKIKNPVSQWDKYVASIFGYFRVFTDIVHFLFPWFDFGDSPTNIYMFKVTIETLEKGDFEYVSHFLVFLLLTLNN